MKNFTCYQDVPNLDELVKNVLAIKKNPFGQKQVGTNKTIGLIFFNPSLRTRLSSIKAAYNLGAQCWVLNAGTDSWQLETRDGVVMNGDTQEHIQEAIGVMSTYCDVLGVRTFPGLKNRQEDYEEVLFNKVRSYATVPVVSLESATLHPLQSLTDLATVEEHKTKERVKVVLSWAPHVRALPQAVPNSFAQWFSNAQNIDFIIAHPVGATLDQQFTQSAIITHNQNEAFENADFIYAKNWSSYEDYGKIITPDSNWMITQEKMNLTNRAKFMHCLPVRRNVVVADAVLNSPESIVIQQAENRVYAAQAVFHELLRNK